MISRLEFPKLLYTIQEEDVERLALDLQIKKCPHCNTSHLIKDMCHHICSICGLGFLDFTKHILYCTKIRTYYCGQCNKYDLNCGYNHDYLCNATKMILKFEPRYCTICSSYTIDKQHTEILCKKLKFQYGFKKLELY